MIAQAIFAAGCFWGVQLAFDNTPGIVSTEAGYVGGTVENPSYRQVSTGQTGHAEAVEVSFDTDKISYPELLDIFFKIHNPTTKNRQGPDIGTQYRSAIFYLTPEQKQQAEAKIAELERQKTFPAPVVTEIAPAGTFWPAEEYHQKYLQKQGKTSCGR
jgi:peptide methionine sulfoxide reductase msrA